MPRLGSRVRVSFSALFYDLMIAITYAQVAELVDAHVSGACVERHAGSSPVLGTKKWRSSEINRFGEVAELVDALL